MADTCKCNSNLDTDIDTDDIVSHKLKHTTYTPYTKSYIDRIIHMPRVTKESATAKFVPVLISNINAAVVAVSVSVSGRGKHADDDARRSTIHKYGTMT
jgi:hypothetical protein